MPTDIKLKNSVTATNAPTSLQQGEVAINITDKKVWVGNAATTPVLLLGSGADGTFTNLTVSGVASFADGTVSLPSITNIGDTNTGIYFPAADTIAFTEGGVESMRIDSSGNVGIGTSSPTQQLDVTATSSSTATIVAQNTTATSGGAQIRAGNPQNLFIIGTDSNGGGLSGTANSSFFYTTSTSPIVFMPNATERMRITSAGNVGIGTTSPGAKLQVTTGGANSPGSNLSGNIGQFTSSGGIAYVTMGNGDSANQHRYIGAASAIQVFGKVTDAGVATEQMRIDSDGNVMFGVTSLAHTSDGFTLEANGQVPYVTRGSAGTFMGFFNRTTATLIGSITNVSGTATAFNTTSDYRLKENIAPMTGALAKVSQLKPCTYTWKSTGEDGQGFIAHELQEVVAGCVTGEKDAVDKEGKPIHQSIDTSFLVATLTAAIQELKAEFDAYKATHP